VPPVLRASAMAAAIFVIHPFGDFWSPALVGLLAGCGYDPANPGGGLQRAMLVLPAVMCLAVFFWGWLAWRQRNVPLPWGRGWPNWVRFAKDHTYITK
jgi:hypothetical protein